MPNFACAGYGKVFSVWPKMPGNQTVLCLSAGVERPLSLRNHSLDANIAVYNGTNS